LIGSTSENGTETAAGLIEALEKMILIREFEQNSAAMQARGEAPTMCTAVGQEAAAVGVISQLDSRDLILTNHRSAGHLIARGAEPGRILAEILGKATGYCKGRSGSLHISVKELGVILTSTIVGGELALAAGVGLTRSMSTGDGIVVCFFGDGAACEGIFHESLNLAAVWNLPILYVCENNQWQAFVHRRETMLTDHIADWARPYGIETRTVDGNDVETVMSAAGQAVEFVRNHRKPFFLETRTYRLRGHMEPDDQAYVDKEELASWRTRDPISTIESKLLERGVATAGDLESIRARVDKVVSDAVAFASASPYPTFDELTADVYA